MFGQQDELLAVKELDNFLRRIDASSLSSAEAVDGLRLMTRHQSVVASLVFALKLRIEETNAHKASGASSAADFVASETGTTGAQAKSDLDTARKLADMPTTADALTSGDLSPTQASLIADAASSSTQERDLLATAAKDSTAVLAEQARKLKAFNSAEGEANSDAAKRRLRMVRIRKNRPDGMGSLYALLLPEEIAYWESALNRRRDLIFRRKRSDKVHDSFDTNMADAFMSVGEDAGLFESGRVTTSPGSAQATDRRRTASPAKAGVQTDEPAEPSTAADKPKRGRSTPKRNVDAMLIVDYAALKRGWRDAGETVEIEGCGTVSVATALELLGDAMFRILVTDGSDVKTVTSKSRYWKAKVDVALNYRDQRCCVPGCDNKFRLEKDHKQWYSKDGPTSYENGRRICSYHHGLITYKGYRLVGEPGKWQWLAPGEIPFDETG